MNSKKNVELLSVIAACLLVTSVFTVIPVFSAQPPTDKSTYYVGTIGQPRHLDPAVAYDTASDEIIQNVYQTLIWYGSKNPVTFTPGVGHNLTSSEQSDLSVYVPCISMLVPTTANGGIYANGTGTYYTFTINTNAQFPSWTMANGSAYGAHNVTVDDVVYSFQRQMVYDSPNAPTWMWYQTAFNNSMNTWDDYFGNSASYTNGTFKNTANESTAASMIQNWCFASSGTGDHIVHNPAGANVTFWFQGAYAPIAMYQIFSQTWGSVLEKAWVIQHGGWDGSFAQGWSNWWRQKPSYLYSELDVYKDPSIYTGDANHTHPGSYYPSSNPNVPNMLGTGPYNFTSWDETTYTWRIDANPNYWMGWSNAGDKAGNYIHTVIETGVNSWQTRKMMFLNGEFDVAVVPTANMDDLLQTGSNYNPIAGLDLAYNIPELETEEFFFCMNVSAASPYQSYVGYQNHTTAADPTFFADQNIRTAFAWALNDTAYINQAWSGEAEQHATWWCNGLEPHNANDTSNPLIPTLRNLNYAEMKSYLDKAALINGRNVSQDGFDVTFLYNIGNNQRRIVCQDLADAWNTLGSKYHVNVVGVIWPTYLGLMFSYGLPGYTIAWLADFADASDFAGVYMASSGAFSWGQGPPWPADQATIDAEVTQAAVQTNNTARVAEYQDLEYRYWNDCISIPLEQPTSRHWSRDWVQGWYYNAMYPGLYAYDLYKSAPTTYQPVEVDVTSITPITAYPGVYVSMGQMKQLYGGGAPATMTFQVHVKRNDANTNVTLLTVAVSLERFNLTALGAAVPVVNPLTPAYLASTIVLLAPGADWTGVLTWYEDGVVSTCQANATWEIAAFVAVVAPIGAEVNNTGNNFLDSGFNSTVMTSWNATSATYYLIPGDLNGDGVVNILDAIGFMNCYGKSSGQPGYNQAADLNGDGVIDVYDAILFSVHLGQKAVNDP